MVGNVLCELHVGKQVHHHRYLATRIPYYGNSTSTFQLELLISGDINPNPGPVSSNDLKRNLAQLSPISYNCDELLHYTVYVSQNTEHSLHSSVLEHLQYLGILKKQYKRLRTHRCKKAGRRRVKQVPVVTNRPHHLQSSEEPSKTGNRSNAVCFDNLKSLKLHITDKLNVCSLNTQSIRNKTNEFVDFVLNQILDVIAVSETWLKPDDLLTIGDLTPADYTFQHVPRLHTTGGGVGLLFISSLYVAVKSNTVNYSSFEAIHAEITSNSQSLRLVNIYRPPGCQFGTFLTDFENMIADYVLHPSDVVFCGDFNIHMDDPSNLAANRFKDLLFSFGLLQHIN